jgi:tetratricopeptide (TPR) repeat protein
MHTIREKAAGIKAMQSTSSHVKPLFARWQIIVLFALSGLVCCILAFLARPAFADLLADKSADPSTAQAAGSNKVVAPSTAEDIAQAQERVLKMQEQVLNAVETSNQQTKEEMDLGLAVVGGVGTLVVAVFAFFGLSTAAEARAEAREIKKQLDTRLAEANQLVERLKTLEIMKDKIAADVLAQVKPKLGAITDYGMKMAEFAGGWNSMSLVEKVRDAEEVEKALGAVGLDGEYAQIALSFLLARKGMALLDNGQAAEALAPLKHACEINPNKKPDRHYNLACCYARLSTNPNASPRYKEQAIQELQRCIDMAIDAEPTKDPQGNDQFVSVSKARFKSEAAKDKDFLVLKSEAHYRDRLEKLAQPYQLT